MHQNHNNHQHSQPKRYQYKGCWIEISLTPDFEQNRILYIARVEIPTSQGGVVYSPPFESRDEAEFVAEEMIDSWN